jgi:1-acyl-sn-glycerol-3-phosphate acyltransferase
VGEARGPGLTAEGDGTGAPRGAREVPIAPRFSFPNRVAFHALRALVGAATRAYLKLDVRGEAHLPPPPFLVAANHRSYLDPLVVQVAVRERLVYLMTAAWYQRPGWRWLFRFLGAIPVRGAGGNRAALEAALVVLRAGGCVAIFPEGRIHDAKNGPGEPPAELLPLHPGALALARRAGVPIVPIGIAGSDDALRKGSGELRRARVAVRIGPPLSPWRDAAGHRDGNDDLRHALTALAADARAAIAR